MQNDLQSETQVSHSDSSPESSIVKYSPSLSPSSTPTQPLRTLSLYSEKEEKLLKEKITSSQISSSIISNPTASTHNSIFSLFPEIKKPHSENKKILVDQLMKSLTKLLQSGASAIDIFTKEAESLTSMDAKNLAALLSTASGKILSNKTLTKQLRDFLEINFKSTTSRLVDYVHTSPVNDASDLKELLDYKTKIHRNVIGISLIEKLLFPLNPLDYGQSLNCKGFSSKEKKQLSDVLIKIDSRFSLSDWPLFWDSGPEISVEEDIPPAENKSDRRESIQLDSLDTDLGQKKKSHCWCGF